MKNILMKNQLLINIVANMFAFFINVCISFFLTPYLINKLGKEAYSFFPIANNFINYAGVVTIALNSMASRFITIRLHEEDEEGANTYFNSVLLGNTLIAVFMSIIGIIIIVNLQLILNIPKAIINEVKLLFLFIFSGLFLSILGSIFSVATFAKNRVELSALRTIESKIIYVVILMALLIKFEPSLWYIGIANLISVIFIVITNIIYTKKLLPEININRRYFNIKAIGELISSGIWNTINQLSVILLSGVDLLIINILIGVEAGGEYAIVQTIPNIIQMLVATMTGAFVPQFTILFAKNKETDLIKSIVNSIKIMALIIIIPIGFLIIFGDVFFDLWIPGQDYRKLHLLSIIIILPMIITGSINTMFNVYTVTNKLKIPSIILLISSVVNIVVVIMLVLNTKLGIWAIPLTSAIIGVIRNLTFTPIYAAKCLKVKWNTFYLAIIKGIICAVNIIFICLIVKINFTVDCWVELILVGVFISICGLTINAFVILNRAEKKELMEFIRYKLKKE